MSKLIIDLLEKIDIQHEHRKFLLMPLLHKLVEGNAIAAARQGIPLGLLHRYRDFIFQLVGMFLHFSFPQQLLPQHTNDKGHQKYTQKGTKYVFQGISGQN